MNKSQGFSLVETLISLVLIMSFSFGFLNQQRQMSQLFYHITYSAKRLIKHDNHYETTRN